MAEQGGGRVTALRVYDLLQSAAVCEASVGEGEPTGGGGRGPAPHSLRHDLQHSSTKPH